MRGYILHSISWGLRGSIIAASASDKHVNRSTPSLHGSIVSLNKSKYKIYIELLDSQQSIMLPTPSSAYSAEQLSIFKDLTAQRCKLRRLDHSRQVDAGAG